MKLRIHLSLGILVLFNLVLIFLTRNIPTVDGLPEHLYLNAKGGSMYPAIRDGDHVKVKLCVDGELIEVGDIIVYCSLAAGGLSVNYGGMWIGHRVIQKFRLDGKWCFKTQGDNCSKSDPWIVREHFLLGKVVGVCHVGSSTPTVQETETIYQPTSFEGQILGLGWATVVSGGWT